MAFRRMASRKPSSNHSKITGDFGEHLTLYWLSKFGFECARVDHTGIDIIARRPHSNEVLGISVKARSRSTERDYDAVAVRRKDLLGLKKACKAFKCRPYFSFAVDRSNGMSLYIVPLRVMEKLFGARLKRGIGWAMNPDAISRYRRYGSVRKVEFTHSRESWWRPRRRRPMSQKHRSKR